MRTIDNSAHIPNTGKLLIVWQQPEGQEAIGTRYIVGEIRYGKDFEQLCYYDNQDIAQARKAGFRELDVFRGKENTLLYNQEISIGLEKRLPPRTREDFDHYLQSFRISPEIKDELDTLTLLANTGRGKTFGDGYSFFPDIESAIAPFDVTFEIAGFRHHEGMQKLDINELRGKKVVFERESNNSHDNYAIRIMYDSIKLGYVPKGLNKGLYKFLDTNSIDASIERLNGTKDRPNVLVLASVV